MNELIGIVILGVVFAILCFIGGAVIVEGITEVFDDDN